MSPAPLPIFICCSLSLPCPQLPSPVVIKIKHVGRYWYPARVDTCQPSLLLSFSPSPICTQTPSSPRFQQPLSLHPTLLSRIQAPAHCPHSHSNASPGLVTVVVTVVVVMMVVVVSSSPPSGTRGGPGEAGPGRGGAVVPGGGVSSSGAVGPAPLPPSGVTAVVRGPVPGSVARGREGAARVWPAGGVASVGSGSDPGTVQGKSGCRRSKLVGHGWGTAGLRETGGSPTEPKRPPPQGAGPPPLPSAPELCTFSQGFHSLTSPPLPLHLSTQTLPLLDSLLEPLHASRSDPAPFLHSPFPLLFLSFALSGTLLLCLVFLWLSDRMILNLLLSSFLFLSVSLSHSLHSGSLSFHLSL